MRCCVCGGVRVCVCAGGGAVCCCGAVRGAYSRCVVVGGEVRCCDDEGLVVRSCGAVVVRCCVSVGGVRVVVVGAVRVDGVVVVRRSVLDAGVCVRSAGVCVVGGVRELVPAGALCSPVVVLLRVALLLGVVVRCGVSPFVRGAWPVCGAKREDGRPLALPLCVCGAVRSGVCVRAGVFASRVCGGTRVCGFAAVKVAPVVPGIAGCTGYCSGTHLHFEVRQDGVAFDPAVLLPATIPAPEGG